MWDKIDFTSFNGLISDANIDGNKDIYLWKDGFVGIFDLLSVRKKRKIDSYILSRSIDDNIH